MRGADVARRAHPDIDEAEALVSLVRRLLRQPSSSPYDQQDGLAPGNHTDAFAVAAGVPEDRRVGVNCCARRRVAGAIAFADRPAGKPVIVYRTAVRGGMVGAAPLVAAVFRIFRSACAGMGCGGRVRGRMLPVTDRYCEIGRR